MAVRPINAKELEKKLSEWLGQPGNGDYYSGYDAALCAVQDLIADMPTLTPPNEWVSVEDELPKLPDCDRCSMMVNTARKGNPKSLPMIYERAIVRGKRVERWKYYWDRIADEPPDYWMYLPKPPTKET